MFDSVRSKRHLDVDTLSGVLILQMIFVVHCAKLSGIKGIVIDSEMLMMQFFMPWFFYKSGMFYHAVSIGETIKKGICHFIKPFIIFSLILQVVFAFAVCREMYLCNIQQIACSHFRHCCLRGYIGMRT